MRKIACGLALVFAFTVPWEVVVESPLLGSAAKLIGLALAVFWAATVVLTGRLRKPRLFHFALMLFILWNGISIFWSKNPDRTLEHLGTWIQLFILVFILWDLFDTRGAVMAGLQMYILGAYVVFGNMLVNFLAGATFYYERFSASGTNPDDLGIILALGMPVAWYLSDPKSAGSLPAFLKWVNYAYIPAAVLGVALSGTRTALVALFPGILFSLASFTRLKLWAKALLFIFLAGAVYFLIPVIPPASLQRLSTTGSELSSGDLNGRTELWSQGINAFLEKPLLGVGSNMYRSTNRENKVAHNSFLSVLVETGVVGLVLFGIVLAIIVSQALAQSRWNSMFWLVILSVWVIGANTLTWEYRKPTWLFFSLILASAALTAQPGESAQKAIQAVPESAHLSKPQVY